MDNDFWNELDAIAGAGTASPFATNVNVCFDPFEQLDAFMDLQQHEEEVTPPSAPLLLAPAPDPVLAPSPTPVMVVNTPPVAPPTVSIALGRVSSDVIDTLRDDLKALVEKYGEQITLPKLKREVTRVWKRKFPDSKIVSNPFQAFIKDNIKRVRDENAGLGHGDHMKMLGTMWRETKKQRTC